MEIQVISSKTIKPSSPTPPHLQTFKTSIFDKLVPRVYIQFISFYIPNQNDKNKISIQRLEESLSQCLTIFYPIAGRINDDNTVDCNDDGVLFITTRVNSKLSDLLSPQPKINEFHSFSPPIPPFCPELNDRPAQLGIQVNQFNCGGIAISICFSHFIIDAATMAMFLKYWSGIATQSSFDASIIPAVSMFPQGSDEPMPEGSSVNDIFYYAIDGRGTTRRFVFEGWAINALKEKIRNELVANPTRVETVTSFLWKHMMAASEGVSGCKQSSILTLSVNLRRQMVQNISSEFSVGNMVWSAISHYHNTNLDKGAGADEKQLMLGLLREAIEKTKDEFVRDLLSKGGFDTIRDSLVDLTERFSHKNAIVYTFTSWCKIGLSSFDFGWGKPIWVSQMAGTDVPFKNVILLADGETDESIEAWMTLDPREMQILEDDQEFLAFASPNPPISL